MIANFVDALGGLLDRLSAHPETVEAFVIITLVLLFTRYGLPIIFDFRTRIQKALEETYEVHIKELKEMIDTQHESAKMCREQMETQAKQLNSVNAKLTALLNLMIQYNCKAAPDCDNRQELTDDIRSLVEKAVCDTCVNQACSDCSYAEELNRQ